LKPGLFDLITPGDLLAKLRHDLARIEANWLDTYAAFDFFVTADHMVDWLHPNDRAAQAAERAASPLVEISYHISSGAKHFEATHPRHKSVDSTGIHHGQFSNEFSREFDVTTLEILLTDPAAKKLGFKSIDALGLAQMVLEYWEHHPAIVDGLADARNSERIRSIE
jgi:hypothetical protein